MKKLLFLFAGFFACSVFAQTPQMDLCKVNMDDSLAALKSRYSPHEIELAQRVLSDTGTRHSAWMSSESLSNSTPACDSDCSQLKYHGEPYRSSFEMTDGMTVETTGRSGVISWVASNGKSGQLDIVEFVKAAGNDYVQPTDKHAAPIIIGVLITANCFLQRQDCFLGCRMTCPCGAHVTAILCGVASCQCNCIECTVPPNRPRNPWPVSPSGPFFPSIPWDFVRGGPWVRDSFDPAGWLIR